jgi:hypothetical protein
MRTIVKVISLVYRLQRLLLKVLKVLDSTATGTFNRIALKVPLKLEERHKLPRRIVLTRWLSSAEAVRVVLNSRRVYKNFFSKGNNDLGCR